MTTVFNRFPKFLGTAGDFPLNRNGRSELDLQRCVFEAFLTVSSDPPEMSEDFHQQLMEEFQRRFPCRDPKILAMVWAQFESYSHLLSQKKLI